jgi:hypothetical protein
MADQNVRGRFVWHELMTNDTEAAARFYGRVVGWKAQPWEHDPGYALWMGPGGPVGGLMKLSPDMPAGTPPHWMLYIGAPNVDETVAQAQRLGAKLHKAPWDIPNVGRIAVLEDPQGAMFMVMASQEPAMPETGMKPVGDFSWHELATTNFQAAFDFYRALFGWEVLDRLDMGPSGIYLIFGWGGQQRGGIYNKTAEMTWPSNWLSYARVPNADAAAAQARGIGGKVTMGPMDVPGGDRIAVILDPQGATFAVHATKAAAMPAEKKPEAQKKVAAKKAVTNKTTAKKPAVKKAPTKKAAKKKAKKAPKRTARKSAKKAAKSKAGRSARARKAAATRRPRRAK